MTKLKHLFSAMLMLLAYSAIAQPKNFSIIAYYSAGPEKVDSLPAEKLTHIIYSFGHLKGNELTIDNANDSLTIKKLVGLKSKNSHLKVILSLGGWGGCQTCSDVFSTAEGREAFAKSVLLLNQYFKSDGIDLDWEYPAIEGHPGHKFMKEDRENFTALVQTLRRELKDGYEISFAAGGFQNFLIESIDWVSVMPLIDRVNLMSYDLVHGYSTTTGHHTPLYSTPVQSESTHNAVRYLLKQGVPREKIVIGAAFYARIWADVQKTNDGLYQPGVFKTSLDYKTFVNHFSKENNFKFYWDEVAQAPYAYSSGKMWFATFDDYRSMALKTRYVIDQKLNGIMFWELSLDNKAFDFVSTIYNLKANNKNNRKIK